MDSSSPTRPLTRSQTTPSLLGKRTARPSLSRTSSNANKPSSMLLTPESSPRKKRVKRECGTEEYDPRANKENIPPPDMLEFLLNSPSTPRLSRRSSFSSDISSISTISRSSLRRSTTQAVIPQTPSTSAAATFNHLSLATPPLTPPFVLPLHLRVRALLRSTSNSSSALMSLAGREAEKALIESFFHGLDDDADVPESVLYISGSPGTGKTALVNSIIENADLKSRSGLKVVFLNCMAIADMDTLWRRLAEELGDAIAPAKRGIRKCARKAQGRDDVNALLSKSDMKFIIVLDELDNLSGATPGLLKPLFSLIALYQNKVKVIGIANTHTLTSSSSTMSLSMDESTDAPNCGPSAISIKTIHFAPYTPSELQSILAKRFIELPQNELKKLLPSPALTLLTKKVSSLTGDVRVLFEVLRGAIDIAIPSSVSLDVPPAFETNSKPVPSMSVTPGHVLLALKSYAPSPTASKTSKTTASSTSETVTKVSNLNLQSRLVLLTLSLACRRLQATLSLTGCASSISPPTLPSSPTKKSPMKRSNSSQASSSSSAETVEAGQLYTYYMKVLEGSDSFTPVSRSDFTDLLGVLDTSGLIALSSAPSSGTASRAIKRTTSFSGAAKAKGAATPQSVRFQSDIREAEVVRGLGISVDGTSMSKNNESEGDALEDDVRRLWSREISRMRREAKAKNEAALALLEQTGPGELLEEALGP